MLVDIYYNLHKKCLSVRARRGPDKGRVVQHRQKALIQDVSFVVNQRGREKVVAEKRKNVHAFVRGKMKDEYRGLVTVGLKEISVSYNPYKSSSFINEKTKQPIYNAKYVIIQDKKIRAFI